MRVRVVLPHIEQLASIMSVELTFEADREPIARPNLYAPVISHLVGNKYVELEVAQSDWVLDPQPVAIAAESASRADKPSFDLIAAREGEFPEPELKRAVQRDSVLKYLLIRQRLTRLVKLGVRVKCLLGLKAKPIETRS